MDLGQWIKTARERTGLSQTEFGERFGVSKQGVSHWERNRNSCSVPQFLRIAEMANMNPAELDDWPPNLSVFNREESMNGWPLSPQLLAALQNLDARTARRAENTLRSLLDMPTLPIEETLDISA